MNKLFLLLVMLASFSAYADQSATPYSPEEQTRFNAIEANSWVTAARIASGTITEAKVTSQGVDGLHLKRVARVTFDSAASGMSVGAHASTVFLPAKALIERSYIYFDAQIVDTGTCTHAVSCEDANNIKTATDLTGSATGSFLDGQSTGTAASMVGAIAASCAITLTVADGGACTTASAGKITVFVEYEVQN